MLVEECLLQEPLQLGWIAGSAIRLLLRGLAFDDADGPLDLILSGALELLLGGGTLGDCHPHLLDQVLVSYGSCSGFRRVLVDLCAALGLLLDILHDGVEVLNVRMVALHNSVELLADFSTVGTPVTSRSRVS